MMARRLFDCAGARDRRALRPFAAVPVAEILCWPDDDRQRLRLELKRLFRDAFVRMPMVELQDWVEDYFTTPAGGVQRYALLLADEADQLAATTLFDCGRLEGTGKVLQGIYIVDRAVAPAYQDCGLGRSMAAEILVQFQPDVLMTTCTQSASLHSWILVVRQAFAATFEVFPRWEQEALQPLPTALFDFVVSAFRQLYLGITRGAPEPVDRAVAGLSPLLVRKGVYRERYDTLPWEKGGRKDTLAEALGAGDGDGVLLVVLRKELK